MYHLKVDVSLDEGFYECLEKTIFFYSSFRIRPGEHCKSRTKNQLKILVERTISKSSLNDGCNAKSGRYNASANRALRDHIVFNCNGIGRVPLHHLFKKVQTELV